MNKLLYFLCLLFILASCRSTEEVLPKEKMEKVMWDVAQSSEFLNGYVYYKYPEQNRAALNDAMLQKVFKIHNINKEQFNNTLEYYEKRPDELKAIVDTIVSRQKKVAEKDSSKLEVPATPVDTAIAL